MRNLTNLDIREKHALSLSLRFLSDGSIVVKKGSTTIQKNGASATVTGSMTKDFKEEVVDNINLVQETFRSWMSELRGMQKNSIRDYYHGEEVIITSIKYTRVVTTLVEEVMPESSSSTNSTKGDSKDDFEKPLSGSVSIEQGFPGFTGLGKKNRKNLMQSRQFSTMKSEPVSLVPYVSPHLDLVPRVINLLRDEKGSYYLDDISINLLNVESPDLKEHLSSLISLIRKLYRSVESVNDGGYCNITRLSEVPVIADYLKVYVQTADSEVTDYLKSSRALDEIGLQGILKRFDDVLTPREKVVLLPWLSSLLNLNMYFILIDVLDRLGVSRRETKSITLSEILTISEKESIYDLIDDIKTYSDIFHGRLNPSIRESMRQRGITISENVYCGFDTEYKNIDMKNNKILSAQWAVNSKLVLSLPYLSDYNLSIMNIETGKEYPINPMWFHQGKIGYSSIQDEIRCFVNGVRSKRFGENDICLKNIVSGLINEGIPYFIDKSGRQINFSFDRSPIKTYFKGAGLERLDLKKLVQIGLNLEGNGLVIQKKKLIEKLVYHSNKKPKDKQNILDSNFTNLACSIEPVLDESSNLVESSKPSSYKGRFSRSYKKSFTPSKISVTTRRNFNIIGHLTQADLSLLTDFDTIKKDFDIVNKSLVTLGRSSIVLWGNSIIFRDTLLLAPGGKKSLASIGSMYGTNLQKINLTEEQHQNMDILLKENPILFKDYALRDSLISLFHACILEDSHFKLNKLGIPLTLSILGSSNLRHSWVKKGYEGYQLSSDYKLADTSKTPTPKGLFAVGDVGLYLNNYISNYKGGRNESFAIGYDQSSYWYDYDLTAAYTTVMSMMGDPNYTLARRISASEISEMTNPELLYSYTTIEVNSFEFPETIKYPSIACYADELTTFYPRRGKAVLTGSEYITALNQGCEMEVSGGTLIPFKIPTQVKKSSTTEEDKDSIGKTEWQIYKEKTFGKSELWKGRRQEENFVDMPFRDVIADLALERAKYPKGTISNLLYKEMGNSIYGAVCRGISHKVRYDIKTDRMVRMESSEISNPILASWITAFVRSLIGEIMHRTSCLGGKIVSCTTDGFITDIRNLESKLLKDSTSKSMPLLRAYNKTRKELCGDPTALELKHEGTGLMSWTTRGQLSEDMNLKAITGLQHRDQTLCETKDLIYSEGHIGETVSFISESLRSAKELIKVGGHVTRVYRDQNYRVHYDNKRFVTNYQNEIGGFRWTIPWESADDLLTARTIAKVSRGEELYQRNTSKPSMNKYKCLLEIGIRTFVKDVLNNRNGVGMKMLKNYSGVKDFITKFLIETDIDLKVSVNSKYLSRFKISSIGKSPKLRMVPRSIENLKFFDYVKSVFPDYDTDKVLKKL